MDISGKLGNFLDPVADKLLIRHNILNLNMGWFDTLEGVVRSTGPG